MFSRKIECGMPTGRRFFIAARKTRVLMFLLPSNLILPTLTFGPSFTTNVMPTAAGGIWRISVRIVANCRPCSASSPFIDTSAFLVRVGSYWLSTTRPTFLLEAVQNIAGRYRTEAGVVDGSNRRLLFYEDDNAPPLGRLLTGKAYVLKVARVPQRVEVALQGGRIVNITGLGKNAGADRFGGNAAVAADIDLRNNIVLSSGQRAGRNQERRQQ